MSLGGAIGFFAISFLFGYFTGGLTWPRFYSFIQRILGRTA